MPSQYEFSSEHDLEVVSWYCSCWVGGKVNTNKLLEDSLFMQGVKALAMSSCLR